MKIEDILKKQGEIYRNLTSNKTIKKYNETIGLPKYKYLKGLLSKQEYKAIKGLEKFLGEEPVLVDELTYANDFEISINGNKVTYLKIRRKGLEQIPESINSLTNLQILSFHLNRIKEIKNIGNLQDLQELHLGGNEIQEIKNLDNLTNLKTLSLYGNQIQEIKNLDSLQNLEGLNLNNNKIKEIKGLDKLQNLQLINLAYNQITEIKNLDNLTNLQTLFLQYNQIKRIENVDNLQNLQILYLEANPIKNKKEARKLWEDRGIIAPIL